MVGSPVCSADAVNGKLWFLPSGVVPVDVVSVKCIAVLLELVDDVELDVLKTIMKYIFKMDYIYNFHCASCA